MIEVENILPDIPRLVTALAEWIACMLCIFELKQRISGVRLGIVAAAALIVQCVFLEVTGKTDGVWWIVCMTAAIGIMYVFIYGCCRISKKTAGYYCVRAFVVAEFAASLEWQITCFLCGSQLASREMTGIILMILIFVIVYTLIWYIYRNHTEQSGTEISLRELVSYVIIGAAVFLMSNLGFVAANTPFSGSYTMDIFTIRTLVDFGGVAILYAYHVQRGELRIRYELESVQKLLYNQYNQYQQSEELVDLINIKYHDLKHYILMLRDSENGSRNEYLDKLENEIKNYEAQNKTGNKILDTLLTAKNLQCTKYSIAMTSVVDGALFDFMDVMDICSIFGNALDNAIEYESQMKDREKRLIHVMAYAQKQLLIIRIENYYEGKPVSDKKFPATTKADARFHGFGLKSIQYTVKKYGGALDISVEDHWFNLKILIPLPK